MRLTWCWLMLVAWTGWGLGQTAFHAKTPLGTWLQTAPSHQLALGVAGKSVWLPYDAERWLAWWSEEASNSPSLALAKWWLSEQWGEVKELSVPSLTVQLHLREMVARRVGDDNRWERLSALTVSYHPNRRWGGLVRVRHHDLLPLLDAYPTPTLEVATVRGIIGTTVWEFGRNYYRWGPGFLGAPLISDQGYPLDGIAVGFTAKLPLVGRWHIRQLHAYLHGDLPGRFLLARRWEKSLGSRWQFGATEINLSHTFPTPLALFLPFYPVSRLAVNAGWRKEGSDQVIFNFDLTYRSGDLTAYGVMVVDDLKLRWWRKEEQIQRKLGWILGVQQERPQRALGVEYAKFDRLTFTHHVQAPYLYHGVGLGYPTGADSQVLAFWGRYQLLPRLQVSGLLTRSWLDRKTPTKDFEQHWALSLQWLATPQTVLVLHWTRGFPSRWGVGGGWSETDERARFVILEVRHLWSWSATPVPPSPPSPLTVLPTTKPLKGEIAWLTSLKGSLGIISAGARHGVKVGMRLPIVDAITGEEVGTFVVTQVKPMEAVGRVEPRPNTIVRVGSKVLVPASQQ